jgi:hypothetical protein
MIDGYYRCRFKKVDEWEYIGLVRTDFGVQLLYLPGFDEGFALDEFTFHHINIPLLVKG